MYDEKYDLYDMGDDDDKHETYNVLNTLWGIEPEDTDYEAETKMRRRLLTGVLARALADHYENLEPLAEDMMESAAVNMLDEIYSVLKRRYSDHDTIEAIIDIFMKNNFEPIVRHDLDLDLD